MNVDNPQDPKGPPPGVLAAGCLKPEDAPTAAVPVLEAMHRDVPSVAMPTDNYEEPPHEDDFRAMLAQGAPAAGVLELALKRIAVLEASLIPFATHATMMANAKMILMVQGVSDPEGGTWISNPKHIQLQNNSGIFYNAANILGRRLAEEAMLAILKRLKEQSQAVAERDAHVADATLQGPVGGPVGGQQH